MVERRGDLSGLNALLFFILVVVAFLAAAFLLYTLITGTPAASPSPSPTEAPSSAPSASASSPSSVPSASAIPSVSASLPVTVRVGEPASVIVDGQVAGQATVVSAKYVRTLLGKAAPRGKRWLVASIRLAATATLPYDENDWAAIDTAGASYGWQGTDPPPSLGQGSLAAGESRTGNVTFQLPVRRVITSLVLGADDGSQLVVVTLP